MVSQPIELSTIILKQRVRKYHENPKSVRRMLQAVEETRPDLIITPPFAFYKINNLVDAWNQLKKASPNTALITARNYPSIITPEPCEHPLKGIDGIAVTHPHDNNRDCVVRTNPSMYYNKLSNLDMLISLGEVAPKEFVEDFNRIRIGGYLIRVMKNGRNYVSPKFIDVKDGKEKYGVPLVPLTHKNTKRYDWYKLRF